MLTLPQELIDEMIAHAREDAPNEACGIIAGQDGRALKLFRAENAEASPSRHSVDPQDLFRIHRECERTGWEFLVISPPHTASEAYPSGTDIRLAFWPETFYVLVSLMSPDEPAVRAFRIVEGQVTEEELATG